MTVTRFCRYSQGRRERGKRAMRSLVVVCAFTVSHAARAGAQLTVDKLEMTVTPSATGRVMASFVVRNPANLAAQVTVTREDWDRAENGENRFVPSGSTGFSCATVMNVFPTAFRIEPGAEQTVRIAVDAAPSMVKECWDIIFVQDLPQRATPTRSGLQYTLRTGVKVYVVPSALKRDAAISDMTMESTVDKPASPQHSGSTRDAKQQIAIRFNNLGGVHLLAKGRIEFRRLDNSIAMEVPIAEFPMLPGALRRLALELPPTLARGSYIALALIDFGGAEIAAGQIELSVR
jgi:P pilus assembly chaperone PapD